jgi:hypothetical protein
LRISVKSGAPTSGAPVSKLRGETEIGGFFAGIHASKRLGTVGRNTPWSAIG